MVIEFFSRWEFDPPGAGTSGREDIVISRTWYVPREDILAGREDTTLAACLDRETLIPLGELAPPFVALRVDGRYAGDEGYPLVKLAGIRIREGPAVLAAAGGRKKRMADRIARFRLALEARLGIQGLRETGAGEFREPVHNPLLEEKPELFWLVSAGDLMLGRGAEHILLEEGPQGIFGATAGLLREADLTVLNLEGAVSSGGYREEKTFNFRFSPRVAGALKAAGVDAVLAANNHVFDWGPGAFLDTLDHLEAAGIGVLGAGRDADSASRSLVFLKGNARVRAFGIGSFPRERSGWEGSRMAAAENKPGILHTANRGEALLEARLAREQGGDGPDLGVVFFHGGQEWSSRPDHGVRELCTALVRAGADLLIGSHPHIVQGFEWVEGTPVFWSLGNYVFAGMENTGGGDEGLLVRLGFRGKQLVYFEPYPLALRGPRTGIAPREKLRRFYELSRELRSR
jgi:poly-gamma-glutamate synthesis protein (capsule biosynthesis protein)